MHIYELSSIVHLLFSSAHLFVHLSNDGFTPADSIESYYIYKKNIHQIIDFFIFSIFFSTIDTIYKTEFARYFLIWIKKIELQTNEISVAWYKFQPVWSGSALFDLHCEWIWSHNEAKCVWKLSSE